MARLSKSEAARQLGISRTTLYRLIEHGMLSPSPNGRIDDTELVRVAPHVDAIKERIATSSDSDQERHDTSTIISHLPLQLPHDEQSVTPSDAAQERHDTSVTERHWTDDTMRYRTHLEDEVDTLRAQVNRLQAQVECLHDELREARIARDRAQEEASIERARYLQMLEEFSRRYDRLLDMPRSAPPLHPSPERKPVISHPAAPPRDPRSAPQPATRRTRRRTPGTMRERILALLQEHGDGLSAEEIRVYLRPDRPLGDVLQGMRRQQVVTTRGRGKDTRYYLGATGEPHA
jgi:transposase-like protein